MSSWLDIIGLTERQASYVLSRSRTASDDNLVQSATIARVVNGVAVVERVGYQGQRLCDFLVHVPSVVAVSTTPTPQTAISIPYMEIA